MPDAWTTDEIRHVWPLTGLPDADLDRLLFGLAEVRADATACGRGERTGLGEHCICWLSCEEPCCWCGDDSEGENEQANCQRQPTSAVLSDSREAPDDR